MISRLWDAVRGHWKGWLVPAAYALAAAMPSTSAAQSNPPPPLPPAVVMPGADPSAAPAARDTVGCDPNILQAGCSSCASPHLGEPVLDGGCDTCGGPCIPGHKPCCGCCADTCVGRFFGGIYECICCPDPCYDPHWVAAANAALFVDGARPVSQTTLRWDSGLNLQFPDRAEYFWARADGKGKGPAFPINGFKGETSLDYNDLHLITEAASGNFSATLDIPYRSVDSQLAPHAAGFGDITIGTKSMLFDCELLQFTFQFNTTVPSGNFTHGIGNGHVSLEPSLLLALRVAENTYFQGQLSEWIPLGGDADYMGAILHYHTSLNHVLWRPIEDVQLIGTGEFVGYSFQHGQFTDPVFGPFQKASNDSYLSIGPGLRLVICDRIDFGFGAQFAISDRHFAEQLYRTEFRWRF